MYTYTSISYNQYVGFYMHVRGMVDQPAWRFALLHPRQPWPDASLGMYVHIHVCMYHNSYDPIMARCEPYVRTRMCIYVCNYMYACMCA
jgi:hypothetical protein